MFARRRLFLLDAARLAAAGTVATPSLILAAPSNRAGYPFSLGVASGQKDVGANHFGGIAVSDAQKFGWRREQPDKQAGKGSDQQGAKACQQFPDQCHAPR